MIEQIPIMSREQWLEWRLHSINASEAAALPGLDIHPYISPFSLYVEKSNQALPPVVNGEAVSGPMERGILLQPVAIEKLRRDHPDWNVFDPNKYYRDQVRRMGCTPDAFVERPDRPGYGVIQIKSVEPSVFSRTWKQNNEITPPLWIVVQAAVEQELTGAAYAMVVPMIVGFDVQVHEIDIPHEPTLISRIEAEVRDFWIRVENKRPPDVSSPRDVEVLQTLYRSIGGTVDLTADNELTALADEDEKLKRQAKVDGDRRAVIKATFLRAMGDAGVGLLADGRVLVRKQVDRKGYSVEPSSYISLSVKEPRE